MGLEELLPILARLTALGVTLAAEKREATDEEVAAALGSSRAAIDRAQAAVDAKRAEKAGR